MGSIAIEDQLLLFTGSQNLFFEKAEHPKAPQLLQNAITKLEKVPEDKVSSSNKVLIKEVVGKIAIAKCAVEIVNGIGPVMCIEGVPKKSDK